MMQQNTPLGKLSQTQNSNPVNGCQHLLAEQQTA
jgi:hypothetical protein